MSFHLFYLLKDNDYCIQNYRIGAVFTQSFPLIGAWLGLSLKSIAILYSTSFIVLYALTFFCILVGFKNVKLAIIYLFFCILITTHTFFWAQSELPQGVAYLFIYVGLLFKLNIDQVPSSKFKIVGLIGLLIVVVFTHPLLIFPFVFLHVFFYFNNILHRKLIITSFISYGLMLVLKVLFFATPYDRSSMSGLKNFKSHFPNYLDTISFKHFWQYLLNDYYMLLGLFILTFSFLVYSKQWLNLGLMLIATFGYVTLVNVSYINGAEQFYLENQYLFLVLFISVPFVYLAQPFVSNKRFIWSFSLLILVSFIARINQLEPIYTTRLNWIREATNEMARQNLTKVVLADENLPLDSVYMTWGCNYESWLVSTIEQNQTRVLIVESIDHQFDYTVKNKAIWTTLYGDFNIQTLNQQYFKLDTMNEYHRINYNQLFNN